MHLIQYLNQPASRLERAARVRKLAVDLGVTPAFIGQLANGKRPCPAERAALLERASGYVVRRWDLRPNDWWLIWPELERVEGAPAVKATSQQVAHAA